MISPFKLLSLFQPYKSGEEASNQDFEADDRQERYSRYAGIWIFLKSIHMGITPRVDNSC